MKLPQTYRFELSDREHASAWLREYYRRARFKVLLVSSGPALIVLGAVMLRSPEAFSRTMGALVVLFGVWRIVKPFVLAWATTARRRRQRRGPLEVRFDRQGMHVDDGSRTTDVPWDRLSAAGEARDYVWLELKSGSRAIIPRRAIDDAEALRELLSTRLEWRG
ncbi:MAG: YcxB family protein [Sandaracinaceae bacterium]|nr:YcxB family protein [Sandaracinaceae bacterium]